MGAPAFYVDWDTNGINQVAVTSGHASNGFITNEVPTSAELNKWMNGVGLWVRYFAGLLVTSKVIKLPPAGPGSSNNQSAPISNTTEWFIGIPLQSGDIFSRIDAVVTPNASCTISVQLRKYTPMTATDVQIGSTATSATSAVETISITGLTETADALLNYYYLLFTLNTVLPPQSGTVDGAWVTLAAPP